MLGLNDGMHRSYLRHALEPGMLSDLTNWQSMLWVNLKQLRNKILSNTWEPFRPLNLQSQDVVEELTLATTLERRGSCEELKQQHSQIPHIQHLVVSRLLDHLWSEVLWRTAVCETPIVVIEVIGPAKIGKFNDAIRVEQYVLWLDISMNNWWIKRMKILNSCNTLSEVLRCDLLAKSAFLFE